MAWIFGTGSLGGGPVAMGRAPHLEQASRERDGRRWAKGPTRERAARGAARLAALGPVRRVRADAHFIPVTSLRGFARWLTTPNWYSLAGVLASGVAAAAWQFGGVPRRSIVVAGPRLLGAGQNRREMSDSRAELTIIVGYDGSDAARRGLERVRALGERAGAVLLVAVAPDVRSAGLGSGLAGEAFDPQRLLGEARELLDASAGTVIEARAATGDPAVVLVQVAREVGADLVVVGRRGSDFVTRTLLGSVAERVVQQAPCDVLVVR